MIIRILAFIVMFATLIIIRLQFGLTATIYSVVSSLSYMIFTVLKTKREPQAEKVLCYYIKKEENE